MFILGLIVLATLHFQDDPACEGPWTYYAENCKAGKDTLYNCTSILRSIKEMCTDLNHESDAGPIMEQ